VKQPGGFQQALLEAAVLAPSGDNLQPWRFRWENDHLLLFRDVGKDTSLYNVRDLATFVALGAALENVVIAASTFGQRALPALFPDGETGQVVARISFMPGEEPDPLFDAIERRCSNRKFYSKQSLPSGVAEALTAEVKRVPRVDVRWIHDQEDLKRLSVITAQGDRPLFENSLIHSHFFSCIRWTEEEVQKTRDGLPIATLELGQIGSTAFHLLQSANLVRFLNFFGLSRIAASRSGGLIQSSAAVGLITVSEISPQSFILAGRAFERVWLNATAHRLSFQPMTGFILLQLRLILDECKSLTENEIKLLTSTRRELSQLFQLNSQIPALMFRLGISNPPTGRTVRRRISDVLLKAI